MEQSEGTLPYGHREGFFLTFSMGFYPGCSEISWQICMERCSVSFLPSLDLPCDHPTVWEAACSLSLENQRGKPREMSHQGAPGGRET